MRFTKSLCRAFVCICAGSLLVIVILSWTITTPFLDAIVDRYDQLPMFYTPSPPPKPQPTPPMRYHLANDTLHATKIWHIYSHIQGTYMRGEEVRRFLSHQECFSATGEWVRDETPRAMCCKVIVTHTVNFTRHCDYYISYCNANAPAPVVYASPLPPPLAKQIGHYWTSWEPLKWFWQTSPSCPMLPFDREEFCKRIGRGRNFLIAGDSMNYQIFVTFLNFLRAEFSEYQHAFHGCSNEAVCGDVLGGEGFTIGWTNDGLLNATHISYFIELWQIEILLMNRGAWYKTDDKFVAELQEVILLLQLRYPHVLVIYRNTPPGHANCMSLPHPIKRAQEKESLPYNWGNFARQNKIAKKLIRQAHFIYMDIDTMLTLRPDGHLGARPNISQDCLHYSIPGPLDVVLYLFYNTLLLLT